MKLSYDKILEKIKPHCDNIVNIIFNLNTTTNESSDINKIKFSLFHILDGYLNENIGGNIVQSNNCFFEIVDNFYALWCISNDRNTCTSCPYLNIRWN